MNSYADVRVYSDSVVVVFRFIVGRVKGITETQT